VFDANDFAFDIQQVDATFANGLDNDTFPDATGADAFEALEQDTWAPSWNKAVL
jgi:Fe-S cluster biosynthesis and repair protein YggX